MIKIIKKYFLLNNTIDSVLGSGEMLLWELPLEMTQNFEYWFVITTLAY
jgi:hypothetical protein